MNAEEEEFFYLGHCIDCLLRSDVRKKKKRERKGMKRITDLVLGSVEFDMHLRHPRGDA